MNAEDFFATFDVWSINGDLTVESSWAQEGWVENVWSVGGGDDDDVVFGFEAVHFDEELVEGLFAFVVAAAESAAAFASGRSALQVWDISALAAAAQLALIDVRLEHAGRSSLPAISRQRWEPGDRAENHLLVVPETGAVVHLRAPNHDARLVLTPRAGQGPVTIDRRAAMVFADQVELALGREASPSLAR